MLSCRYRACKHSPAGDIDCLPLARMEVEWVEQYSGQIQHCPTFAHHKHERQARVVIYRIIPRFSQLNTSWNMSHVQMTITYTKGKLALFESEECHSGFLSDHFITQLAIYMIDVGSQTWVLLHLNNSQESLLICMMLHLLWVPCRVTLPPLQFIDLDVCLYFVVIQNLICDCRNIHLTRVCVANTETILKCYIKKICSNSWWL